MPEFTRNTKASDLTFVEEVYFSNLTKNAAQITETLQLGRDEGGVLDKKLDPDLLRVVSKIIEMLHDAEYQDEAERELAAQNDPDVAIAILRQAFRVRTERVNDLLVEKLSSLCQIEGGQTAREAVQEATGSELQRLSRLVDEVFLNIGTEAELGQIAADWQRNSDIRIRACTLLIERHRSMDAAIIALDLFIENANQPASQEPLRRLSKAFNILETLGEVKIQDGIVEPLLDKLQQHARDVDIRTFLLRIVESLYRDVLNHIRQMSPFNIQNDMWLALALRHCAIKDPAGTQQMISLIKNQNVNDRFRLELSRRIKDNRIKFSQGMVDELKLLLEKLPYQYEKEMRQNIEETIGNAQGKNSSLQPKEMYQEILEQYTADGEIDEDDKILWDFRRSRGSLNYLRTQLKSIREDDLGLVLKIVYHERFKGQWGERLRIIIDVYPRLKSELKIKAIPFIYEIARNEPAISKDWRYANEFLARLVDMGDQHSELARRYWKKLGEHH